MIFLRHFALILMMLLTSSIYAKDQVPYATQIENLMRYQRVAPGIATSGVLSRDAIQELVKHSFRTVIDLRTKPEGTEEEKLAIEAASMTYINIPVTSAGIEDSQLEAFKQAIAEASPPILLHCATGNRAGAMWASYRLSEGAPLEIALKEGRASGMNSGFEEKVKEQWCQTQDSC